MERKCQPLQVYKEAEAETEIEGLQSYVLSPQPSFQGVFYEPVLKLKNKHHSKSLFSKRGVFLPPLGRLGCCSGNFRVRLFSFSTKLNILDRLFQTLHFPGTYCISWLHGVFQFEGRQRPLSACPGPFIKSTGFPSGLS